MNYILFEDQNSKFLDPFSLTHPLFELRCGMYNNLERVINCLKEDDELILIVREEIQELVRFKYPAYNVNPKFIPKGIFLNASCIWNESLLSRINNGKVYVKNDIVVSANLDDEIHIEKLNDFLNTSMQIHSSIDIGYIKYLWDAIYQGHEQIKLDFNFFSNQKLGFIHSSVIIENDESVFIGDDSFIGAGSVLDATNGPIVIDKNVYIDIGSLIKGPVYIGANSVVNPGSKLRGNVVLGPVCKVGGEIEDSIIQGFSNKQHDGFLGHSYICEWVNLGANTNNSNLKNNYGKIRFSIPGKEIKTEKQFIGVMIGDYSKTGISTMFNTGTYVGVGVNIFGGGFQDKIIESFKWGKNDVTDLDKFLATCNITKSRRNRTLHQSEKKLLSSIYKKNNIFS